MEAGVISVAIGRRNFPEASSAAFDATYIDSIGNGCNVDSLEVLTMSPPPAALSKGTAARDA